MPKCDTWYCSQSSAPQKDLPTPADPPAEPLPPLPPLLGPAVAPLSVEAVSTAVPGDVSAVGVRETPATPAATLQFVPAPACSQPRQPGPCDILSPRWYYDREAGECKDFAFSGCLVSHRRGSLRPLIPLVLAFKP